jgi:hypothetical protein
MNQNLLKLKCWIRGHDYIVVKVYSQNVQKLQCKRCKKHFGINHDVRCVLPWDDELEEAMKIAHPETN